MIYFSGPGGRVLCSLSSCSNNRFYSRLFSLKFSIFSVIRTWRGTLLTGLRTWYPVRVPGTRRTRTGAGSYWRWIAPSPRHNIAPHVSATTRLPGASYQCKSREYLLYVAERRTQDFLWWGRGRHHPFFCRFFFRKNMKSRKELTNIEKGSKCRRIW